MSRRAPTRRQLRGLLRRAGFHAAPAPRPTFLATVAARLGVDGAAAGAAVFALPARARRQVPVIAGALVAVAAAVLAAVFSGWIGHGPDQHSLALAAAVDTTVLMPDGTSVAGRSGLELPDGSVVRTGPNGRASAGDVEIGPTLEALVDSGHLRLRTAGDVVGASDGATAAVLTASSTTSTTKSTHPSAPSTTTRPTTITTVKVAPTGTPTTTPAAKNTSNGH